MSSYDWDYNCAVVDRMFYWQYFKVGTTSLALALTCKDLFFIRQSWYADRAIRRIPYVFILFNTNKNYSIGLLGLVLT